jgi:hypothetical protein
MDFVASIIEDPDANYDSDEDDADVDPLREPVTKDTEDEEDIDNGVDVPPQAPDSGNPSDEPSAARGGDPYAAGSGKRATLKRRMSSMFPMKFNLNKDNEIDSETAAKLQEIFEKFPPPPDHLQFIQVVPALLLCDRVS